jgi:iron complex transport system ATP-binding protein
MSNNDRLAAEPVTTASITAAPVIAERLSLEVGGRTLCRSLDVAFGAGEVWGIVGANGSGKTTLLSVLSGLAAPAAGRVLLAGKPLVDADPLTRARAVGLLPQHEPADYWGTALEYAALGRYPHQRSWLGPDDEDRRLALAALTDMGLTDLAMRRYGTLSGGERQRTRIAQVLAQAPQCLLLDEPLQHLDARHQGLAMRHFGRLARERGATVLIVLHDLIWLAACTHAVVFQPEGVVTAGPVGEQATVARLEAALGCRISELQGETRRFFMPDVQ